VRKSSSDLVLRSLYDLIDGLEDGARLPTVRELMRSFHVSQAAVQRAFGSLAAEGLVTSQVGRGTFVIRSGGMAPGAPGRAGKALDSLLILSNASMNQRCVLVQNHIVEEMAAGGSKVVQLSYHNTGHLLEILGSLPRFDAAILQSHYENIPVRLLHLLQEKATALTVDGHSLSGVDIDRVGTDWEDALQLALRHLEGLGHREIGLISLGAMAQPILSVRRAFERAARERRRDLRLHAPILLKNVVHPSQDVGDALKKALAGLRGPDGTLPFTAVVLVGISDTFGVAQALDKLGIPVPEALSVYILGHRDVAAEHLDRFTVAGSSHRDAAEQLMSTIRNRLGAPAMPPQIVYLPCDETVRGSTAAAPH
jgi:DNA-binding LacI/PurR family transcriptional regulator